VRAKVGMGVGGKEGNGGGEYLWDTDVDGSGNMD
jgi:hypothetical protein